MSDSNHENPKVEKLSLHDAEILGAAIELWLALGKEIAELSNNSLRKYEGSAELISGLEVAVVASRSIVESARKMYNAEQKRASRLVKTDNSGQTSLGNEIQYRFTEISELIDVEPYVILYWEERFRIRELTQVRDGVRYYGGHLLEMFKQIKRLAYDEKLSMEGAENRLREMKLLPSTEDVIRHAPKDPDIPDKQYFKIGEVSEILDVEPYVMRFWESEFKILKPTRTRARQRLYHKKHIESFLTIKKLIYDEKFTIYGAKKRLKEIRKQEAEEKRSRRVAEVIRGVFEDCETHADENSPAMVKKRLDRVLKKGRGFLRELNAIKTDQTENDRRKNENG